MSNEVQNIISNMTDEKRKYETKRALKKGFGCLVEYLQNKIDVERFQQKNPLLTQHAKLCEFLQVKSQEVVPIRTKGMTGNMVPDRCHWNVTYLVKRYGGKRVSGWYPTKAIGATISFCHHSVWRNPEGKLVDPTLVNTGRKNEEKFLVLDEASNGEPFKLSMCSFGLTKIGWIASIPSKGGVVQKQIPLSDATRLQKFNNSFSVVQSSSPESWELFGKTRFCEKWFQDLSIKQKSIGRTVTPFSELDQYAKIAA